MINQLIAKILPFFPERMVWIFSKRYISGQYITDALIESRKLNEQGVLVTVDLLGEYISINGIILSALLMYFNVVRAAGVAA